MQILTRAPNGQLVAAQPYFAAVKINALLGADYAVIPPRSTEKKLVYEGVRRHSLQPVKLSHKVITASDLQGGTIQPGGQSITMPFIVIDGVPIEAGDEIEISKAMATAIGCAAGRWIAASSTTINLTNALRYTATSPDNFGGKPWRFQVLADGTIAGLAWAAPQNIVVGDTGGTSVNGMLRPFDNVASTFADMLSLNNGQGFNADFDDITVVRVEMMVSSAKLSYDTNFPAATFGIRTAAYGAIHTWFRHAGSDVRPVWGPYTWSRGSQEWYYSDVLTTWTEGVTTVGKILSDLQFNDAGGSRAQLHHFGCLVNAPCRLSIGGIFPDLGSIVEVPAPIANAMKPPIPAGDYVVVLNDGTAAWQIKKV